MFSYILERLAWAVAFTVVIAFFLPWVKHKQAGVADQARSEREKQELVEDANRPWAVSYFTMDEYEIEDALADPLNGTAGFRLLLLSRSDRASDLGRVQKLLAIFGAWEIREASIFIYSIPACALIGACIFTAAPRGRLVFLVPLALCILLYLFMRTRLNETYFDRLVLDQAAGLGLWISLYGLLAMSLLLTLRLLMSTGKK